MKQIEKMEARIKEMNKRESQSGVRFATTGCENKIRIMKDKGKKVKRL